MSTAKLCEKYLKQLRIFKLSFENKTKLNSLCQREKSKLKNCMEINNMENISFPSQCIQAALYSNGNLQT